MKWKIIKDFTDYMINEQGDVYSNKRKKILNQYEHKQYLGVYLYSNSKRKFMLVHRLVAMAFIDNPENLPQINHKDENSKNNNVKNLEWCSAKYNANYGHHKEKIKQRMLLNNHFKGKKHTDITKEKMSIAKKGKPSKRKRKVIIKGIEYESVTDAMQKLKLSTKKIYELIKGENKND